MYLTHTCTSFFEVVSVILEIPGVSVFFSEVGPEKIFWMDALIKIRVEACLVILVERVAAVYENYRKEKEAVYTSFNSISSSNYYY